MGGILKKIVVIFQVMVVLIFLVKISTMVEGVEQYTGVDKTLVTPSLAMAQTSVAAAAAVQPSPRDILGDPLTKERTLETALQAKLQQLEQREGFLKTEEQRLLTLKLELTEKIDALRALQQQISTATESYKTEESKKIKELARVYEAMPPAKAGAMLETLDIQTAAGITMNMKRDKAGNIWGYLTPKKAVDITKEITRSLKVATEKKS
jgi:flagellar motility protein MotE (MotC chaperone)